MSFRLFDLNDAQRAAVVQTDGPVLILAGAGTGKTRVITARIAYLIAQGVSPSKILAVTFTNKAAGEMRERAAGMVDSDEAKKLTVSTFHALCVRILRADIECLGYKRNFSIYDQGDCLGTIRAIITRTAAKDEKLDPERRAGDDLETQERPAYRGRRRAQARRPSSARCSTAIRRNSSA